MNKTYENILNDMKAHYYSLSNEVVQKGSPMEKRFEAIASELFAVSSYGDYVLKQLFAKTATGDYLDMHGNERGCIRKSEQKSRGELTFYLLEPCEENVTIPLGTICSLEGKPYIQFETKRQGVIAAGELECVVMAESISCGIENNVPAGAVNVMVNAPLMVNGVYNEKPFEGGTDNEADDEYRERILQHYCTLMDGVNAKAIENAIMQNYNDILDAKVLQSDTPGTIKLVVKSTSNDFDSVFIRDIQNRIELFKVVGARLDFMVAEPTEINLYVDATIAYGDDADRIKQEIEASLRKEMASLRLGVSKSIADLTKAIADVRGVESYNIYCPIEIMGIIPCANTAWLSLDEVEVNCYEQH